MTPGAVPGSPAPDAPDGRFDPEALDLKERIEAETVAVGDDDVSQALGLLASLLLELRAAREAQGDSSTRFRPISRPTARRRRRLMPSPAGGSTP
jgi:hypothetical protein